MITKCLLVGIGGACGAILRFLVSTAGLKLLNVGFFNVTMFINILGSFCIGGAATLIDDLSLRLFLITGCLGGFTTFSTFAYENFLLLQSSQWFLLVMNIAGSVFLSLVSVILGVRFFS